MRKSRRIVTVRFGFCAERVPRLDGIIHEILEIRCDGIVLHTREYREERERQVLTYSLKPRKARRYLRRLDRRYKLHKWSAGYTKSTLAESVRRHLSGAPAGAGRYWCLEVLRGPQQDSEMMAGISEPPNCAKIRKATVALCTFDPKPKILET